MRKKIIFDKQHSDHTDRYINVNINRINSFPTADMNRLNMESYHTREITLEEIKAYIRRLKKKKAPGPTKINKQILEKFTDKTLEQLKKTSLTHVCLLDTFQVFSKRQ